MGIECKKLDILSLKIKDMLTLGIQICKIILN